MVCEIILSLSENASQEVINTLFAQLKIIVDYVHTKEPTLDGLDHLLNIDSGATVGGRNRRTKGKGKKGTKRAMRILKTSKTTRKTKSKGKATRKNAVPK